MDIDLFLYAARLYADNIQGNNETFFLISQYRLIIKDVADVWKNIHC